MQRTDRKGRGDEWDGVHDVKLTKNPHKVLKNIQIQSRENIHL